MIAFLDRLERRKPGGAGDMVFMVPVDLGRQQLAGLHPVSDLLHGEKGGETFLTESKLTLDLAFGLGIFGNKTGSGKVFQQLQN